MKSGGTGGAFASQVKSVLEPEMGLTGRLWGGIGDWLDGLPGWLVLIIALTIVGGVAVVNLLTGDQINVSIFYIGPVVFATWLVSPREGIIVALACTVAWSTVEILTERDMSWILWTWNLVSLMIFLLLAVLMVNLAKRAIVSERDASRTDSLTKVANGRAFEDRAALALNAMRRTRVPLTFCYLDLDHFKEVNDTLGHREGDSLLLVLAESLASRLRTTDLVARLGGDEFGILLPDTGFEAAESVLDDVREALAEAVATRWPVGVTGGAVTFLQPPPSTDQMLGIADTLMYQIKQSGRGRIAHEVWPPESDHWAESAESS
ncbi:MAG: GGDEF domain-containing protein [Actinomycetes bacterium]